MSQNSEPIENHKTNAEFIPTSQWGKEVLVSSESIKDNLIEIKNKIAPCNPRIIAVTKYFGLNAVISAYEAGIRDFGESRALESIEKIKALPEGVRQNSTFHFIGHLQSNKAEKVVKYFDYIHSVDSIKTANAIAKAACSLNKRERILLQVNNAFEEQKSGYEKAKLKEELPEILRLSSIEVVGLMNMAPLKAEREELRGLFRDLREFRDELEKEFMIELPELSMGMSNDFVEAVEEGATIIRIGRKIFN